jgi:hypothetical protein
MHGPAGYAEPTCVKSGLQNTVEGWGIGSSFSQADSGFLSFKFIPDSRTAWTQRGRPGGEMLDVDPKTPGDLSKPSKAYEHLIDEYLQKVGQALTHPSVLNTQASP